MKSICMSFVFAVSITTTGVVHAQGIMPPTSPPPGAGPAGQPASDGRQFRNQPLYDQGGREIGKMTGAFRDAEKALLIQITLDGARSVLVRAARLEFDGTKFVATGYTNDEIRSLPEYRESTAKVDPVEANESIRLPGSPP
jgi:hypothetical protein